MKVFPIVMLASIIASQNTYGAEKINIDSGLQKVSPSTYQQFPGVNYVVKDKEIFALINKANQLEAEGFFDFYSFDEALEDLTEKVKKASEYICKSTLKPETITITVPLLSATWETETLCKQSEK